MDLKDIICQICGTNAPKGGKHYVHYGALCCFSCKGFFRRSTVGAKFLKYACKADYNCEIIDHDRTKCKYCRFQKCLKSGMVSDRVLASNSSLESKSKVRAKRSVEESRWTDVRGSADEQSMTFKVAQHALCVSLSRCMRASDLSVNLLSFHNHVNDGCFSFCPFTKHLLIEHLKKVKEGFRDFAFSLTTFRNMSSSTQEKLLAKNTPLFLHYFLARYLTSRSGFDQISSMLEGQLPPQLVIDDVLSLRTVTLNHFNNHFELLHQEGYIRRYEELVTKIGEDYYCPENFKCLLYQCLLLNPSPTTPNDDSKTMEKLFNPSMELAKSFFLKYCNLKFDETTFFTLTATLQEMNQLFDVELFIQQQQHIREESLEKAEAILLEDTIDQQTKSGETDSWMFLSYVKL